MTDYKLTEKHGASLAPGDRVVFAQGEAGTVWFTTEFTVKSIERLRGVDGVRIHHADGFHDPFDEDEQPWDEDYVEFGRGTTFLVAEEINDDNRWDWS